MEYTVYHEYTIEAESAEEAKKLYIQLFEEGFFEPIDLHTQPEE